MNRTIAAVLAAIALVLAIVGAVMVFGSGLGPLPGTTGAAPADTARTEREHARVARRQKPAADAAPELAFDDTPLPELERLPGAPGTGFVKGIISDVVTGDVVPDAQARLLHPTGEEISRAVADHVGRYQLEEVPEGVPLLIEFTGPGFLTGYCCDIHLQPTEITRKDVSLLRAPVVQVTVRAMPWQRAAASVPVRLIGDGRTIAEAVTDDLGGAQLSVPEFGKLMLHAGGVGGEWAPAPGIELELLPGAGNAEVRADVHRGGRLEVRVKDRQGGNGGGVVITVHGKGLEPISGTTSEHGVVTLGPFAPDIPLQLVATDAVGRRMTALTTRARDSHDEVVNIELGVATRLRGVVRGDDKRPVRRAKVEVYLPDGGPLLGTVWTDERGQFTLDGVPDAPLELRATAPAFVSPAPIRIDRPSKRADVRMQGLPSGTLRGVVRGPDGTAVVGAKLRLAPSELSTLSGKGGSFEIEGVPAGESQRILVAAHGLRIVSGGGGDALLVTLRADTKKRVVILMERTEAEAPPATLEVAATIRVVSGTVVRGDASPVFGAQVWWAGARAVTGADGRFELERTHRPGVVARPFVLIMPPAGLLEPLLLPLHAPDVDGRVEIAQVGLRDRHSCRVSLASTPGTGGRSLTFALMLDGSDRLLGRSQEPFQGRTNVTYDGTWLHIAPIGDWRIGGHRSAFVGVTGATGPLAARCDWPVAAGPSMGVTPEWRDAVTRAVIRVPRGYTGGDMAFRLREAPDGVPIARMGLTTQFVRRVRKSKEVLEPFLGGTWDVTLTGTGGAETPRLRGTLENGKLRDLVPYR